MSSSPRTGFIKIGAVALTVGLFGFIGIRVKETLADRKQLQAAMAEQQNAAKQMKEVALLRASEVEWRPMISITGTLAPVQDADIGFKAGGRLSAVRVKVGDRVKAGQLLASLDVSEAAAQLAAARAG